MIRLLCVGLGGMGRHDWNAAIDCGGFTAVAGVDINEDACTAFTEKTGAPTFSSLDEALTSTVADAALVGTPDHLHAPFAIQALEAGLDVISEKPMAESLEDARKMHETAEANGRMLMVHQQLRWHPMHFTARKLIQDDAIGTVRCLGFNMSVFSDAPLHGYRSKLPHAILQDLAIHHLDLIRYLSGEECDSLYVRDWPSLQDGVAIPTTTSAYAILNMTHNVTACYTSTMRRLLEPVGYECAARITGSKGELMFRHGELTLQTHERAADNAAPQKITPEPPAVPTWKAFAQAIETREPTLTNSADNLKSLAVMFAAIESADSGRVVALA